MCLHFRPMRCSAYSVLVWPGQSSSFNFTVFLNSPALPLGTERLSPTPNAGPPLPLPSPAPALGQGHGASPTAVARVRLTQSLRESCLKKLRPKRERVCAAGGSVSRRLRLHQPLPGRRSASPGTGRAAEMRSAPCRAFPHRGGRAAAPAPHLPAPLREWAA